MYVVARLMVAESRAFFLNLWYSSAAAGAADPRWAGLPPPLQLPSPGQCVQRSHHSGSRPKKGVLGAEKGEGAGRGGTGDRAVRLGGLGLLPSADAEARKSG